MVRDGAIAITAADHDDDKEMPHPIIFVEQYQRQILVA
jgi:hypothetical protein